MTQRFVLATAGHVDHGKSALVRALTGTEPDRWDEERQRGLTIDLGFADMTLDSGRVVSFVDVPGHERFLGNMLAGLGPAPIVCLVVAADEGWSAQTSEHRDAIAALGIDTGLVVISKLDLAPDNIDVVTQQIRDELADTGLANAPIIATSARDGTGLDDFRHQLDRLLDGVAPPDTAAPIRYWVDRSFAVKGAGTVVTGTLAAGTLRVDDALELSGSDRRMTIRNLQSHGTSTDVLGPVTRAAVNLRGVDVDEVARGAVLLTPNAWFHTDVVDVAGTSGVDFTQLAQEFSVHLGTATVYAHCRPLGPESARLTLQRALPLHVGDRLILRGTGQRLITGGATVLDLDPPALRRRGAAARRADALAQLTLANHLEHEVARRAAVQRRTVTAMGIPVPDPLSETIIIFDDWFIDRAQLAGWTEQLREAVTAHYDQDPAAGGIPEHAATHLLGLPAHDLLPQVIESAGLHQEAGRITDPTLQPSLGAAESAMATLEQHFAAKPFTAPTATMLTELGLTDTALAAAAQQHRLLRLPDNIVLGPNTPALAMRELVALDQPFTAAQARQALNTTRRTLIPLLEHLDARGWTQRVDHNLRIVRGHQGP